jgi:hypothetical protein
MISSFVLPGQDPPARPPRFPATPQSYAAMEVMVEDLSCADLLRVASVELSTAHERDGDPAKGIANRNRLVVAMAACAVLLNRGPELVA